MQFYKTCNEKQAFSTKQIHKKEGASEIRSQFWSWYFFRLVAPPRNDYRVAATSAPQNWICDATSAPLLHKGNDYAMH